MFVKQSLYPLSLLHCNDDVARQLEEDIMAACHKATQAIARNTLDNVHEAYGKYGDCANLMDAYDRLLTTSIAYVAKGNSFILQLLWKSAGTLKIIKERNK